MKGGSNLRKYLNDAQQKAAKGMLVRVGFLEGSTHTSKSGSGEIVQTAQVAAWNEWGDPKHNRPPRPFFRQMIESKKGGWGRSMANILKNNNGDVRGMMVLMGEGIKGQLQHSINEFTDPPLAASTIKAKGFDKPLVDTAEMLRAVDFQVFEGEDAVEMSDEGRRV